MINLVVVFLTPGKVALLNLWALAPSYLVGWSRKGQSWSWQKGSQALTILSLLLLLACCGQRNTEPWPFLSSLMHTHCPSMDFFYRITLLSPPKTARVLAVIDQLPCHIALLNFCSSLSTYCLRHCHRSKWTHNHSGSCWGCCWWVGQWQEARPRLEPNHCVFPASAPLSVVVTDTWGNLLT